ncbi:MAG: tautomerase family protein [Candidatus Eremiobacteraeota bacterium]|nr:tautomerase family protein [Candidatus Eremiobacteraeota bacterium]
MPFVRISISANFSDDVARSVADGVHAALVGTIDVPPGDRFQVVTRHAASEMIWDRAYLGVDRSDDAVFVQIFLAEGRSDDKKRALYASIVTNVTAGGFVRPQDVLIVLNENPRVNWSFGNGIAHYVPGSVHPS